MTALKKIELGLIELVPSFSNSSNEISFNFLKYLFCSPVKDQGIDNGDSGISLQGNCPTHQCYARVFDKCFDFHVFSDIFYLTFIHRLP